MDTSSLHTIGIFTSFQEFNTGYSLTGIVVDQSRMLLKHGHKVVVFVNEQYNPAYEDDIGITDLFQKYPDTFKILKKTKLIHLTDYKTRQHLTEVHKREAEECGETFARAIVEEGITRCFTHDFVFTGWSLPYSEAVKFASRKLDNVQQHPNNPEVIWFHWIHSVPSTNYDWWNLNEYGNNHLLVFPNRTTIQQVAEQFKCSPSRIMIVPHIKDIRTWYDFADRTNDFIDKYPKIMDAQIVQVYPASSDRMFAKQVDSVIRMFAYMKQTGAVSVFLCIANQWATGKQPRENVKEYIQLGEDHGLVYGEDFCFTSEYCTLPDEQVEMIEGCNSFTHLKEYSPKSMEESIYKWAASPDFGLSKAKEETILHFKPYKLGIDKRMLRELQLLQSIHIFPTLEESFGLIGPESAFSGCLNVNNRSLTMMFEIMGHMAPAFDFGSHHHNQKNAKDENYLRAVAHAILHRVMYNESVQTKIHCRCRYNMDNIYRRFYLTSLV